MAHVTRGDGSFDSRCIHRLFLSVGLSARLKRRFERLHLPGVRGKEGPRLHAVKLVGEDADVRGPAAADGQLEAVVVRQPVLDGEQHVLALRGEFIGHLRFSAVPAPRMSQHAQGLEPRDLAVGGVLARAPRPGRRSLVRERLIVEMQFDLAADTQVELARGEPGRALLGFGEVGDSISPTPTMMA